MEIRLANKENIPWIVHHRIEMFRSMGYDDKQLKSAKPKIEEFMQNDWDENIKCFLVIENGDVVGGCAVSIYSRLPNPKRVHSAKIAYIHVLGRHCESVIHRRVISDDSYLPYNLSSIWHIT